MYFLLGLLLGQALSRREGDPPSNLGVIVDVLGVIALVLMFVFFCVPIPRVEAPITCPAPAFNPDTGVRYQMPAFLAHCK